MSLQAVVDYAPNLGCDPEFFFREGGLVIGAEKVLPKGGLIAYSGGTPESTAKLIIDGVQAELNPCPSTCRELLADSIGACFHTLNENLKTKKDVTIDFGRTVEINKDKLMELHEDSRKFGCSPSQSIYKRLKAGLKINKVDPTEYRVRAAGGHIHLGHRGDRNMMRAMKSDHEKTVQMLDILCGNTSVLIDRDEGNIERRKVYGRAGEFRLPKHGLEYRTLSNYWLTSYPLMSFATGMARLAVNLVADNSNSELFYKEFTSKVKKTNIHKAINNNDFDLAMENYLAVEDLIKDVTKSGTYGRYPVNTNNVKDFHYFIKTVNADGLNRWFKEDPISHWVKRKGHYMGFNDFLSIVVRPKRKEDMAEAA